MPAVQMATPIATRRLRFRRGDGSEALVDVTLGLPVPSPIAPTRSWACPYEIPGLGAPIRRDAARRRLRRQDSERRETRRVARRAADEVRAARQREGREGPPPHNPGLGAGASGSDH